jgi:acetyl-CoA synthetase
MTGEHAMNANQRISPSAEFTMHAAMDAATYDAWYAQSVNDPEQFWAERARMLDWMQPWHTVKNTSFMDDVAIRWFEGGQLNVAANCLDRHLATRGDKVAIIWQGDAPEDVQRITYRQLYERVNQCANALRRLGVGKGDSVTIYLPMIPEAAIAMLACTRIGAVHSVVFGGFSPEALRSRMVDGNTKLVITADEGVRGGKHVPLKANVDAALAGYDAAVKVLVVARTEADVPLQAGRDYAWDAALQAESTECAPEPMDAEAPLFMLYTSGSTGAPKGVVHTTAGYLLYAALTTKYVFDLREDDVYWCTADVGWITGHSYLLYGPLANGATTLYPATPRHHVFGKWWMRTR